MLRDIMVTERVTANAYFTAGGDFVTGDAVVETNGVFAHPSATTATNLLFVQKARIPVGIECARNEFSDWDSALTSVENGNPAVLVKYRKPDVFASSAVDTTLGIPRFGFYVASNSDGKLITCDNSIASCYKCVGKIDETSGTLAKVEVVDAGSNPKTYTVTVTNPTNGTVDYSVDYKNYIVSGDVVDIIATPDEGYEVDTISVKDSESADVTVANNKFTMPESNVTIAVTFALEQ